jgi:hypothetical protein
MPYDAPAEDGDAVFGFKVKPRPGARRSEASFQEVATGSAAGSLLLGDSSSTPAAIPSPSPTESGPPSPKVAGWACLCLESCGDRTLYTSSESCSIDYVQELPVQVHPLMKILNEPAGALWDVSIP